MKSLVDNTTRLIEQHQEAALDRRRRAAAELATLLRRNDEPQEGDADRLAELAHALDLNARDLPGVLELVLKLDRYEQAIASEAELGHERREILRQTAEAKQWASDETDRIGREFDDRIAPLIKEASRIDAQVQQVKEAKQSIRNVRAQWLSITDGISQQEARECLTPPRGRPHGSDRVKTFNHPLSD